MYTGEEIVEVAEEYLEEQGEMDFKILSVALTGSSLFLPKEETGDFDFLLVVDGLDNDYYQKKFDDENGDQHDLNIESLDYSQKCLNFDIVDSRTPHNVYHGLEKIIYGELSTSFDLFSSKETYKEVLKERVFNAGFNSKSTVNTPRWKKIVIPYLVLRFWEKGEYEFDRDMKKTAQELYWKDNIKAVKWVGDQLGMELNPRIKANFKIR